MKKLIINIMATTGIALVVLSFIALYYGGSLICIRTVFEVLGLNVAIYIGIYILNHFEFNYPILETGIKLIFILALTLLTGKIFGWYDSMPSKALIFMTIIVFAVCMCLDTMNLLEQVKSINALLEENKNNM